MKNFLTKPETAKVSKKYVIIFRIQLIDQSFQLQIQIRRLSIPMLWARLWGWAREVIRQHRRKLPVVIYRTPCGHQLYNTYEVHQYLRLTGRQLGVDLFSFDSCSDSCSRPIQCFKKFKPAIIYSSLDDNSSLYCLKQFLLISFVLLDITDGV